MGGMKPNQNRRPGPERIGSFTAYALRTMVPPPITRATIASPSHVASHSSTLGWRTASRAAADRKSTRLNSSHLVISYAVFCLKKKNNMKYRGDLECKTVIYAER